MMKTGNAVPITRSRAEACRESKENIPLGPPEKKRKLFGRDDYPKQTPTLKYNGREALSVLSTKQPVEESVQAVSVNGPDECEETLMTTSEVEALINMKMAGKAKTDAKGRMDQMMDYIKKVRACSRQFLQKEAGYILEKGKLMDRIEEQRRKREDIEPQQFSKYGNEQHMQVNHLGPALLKILLLPLLFRAGGASRIVNVNSVAHHCGVVDPQDLNLKLKRNSFNCMAAYGASKLAHLMFLSVLSSKLPAHAEIDVIAVHPRIVSTNLLGVIASHYRNKSFWRFDAAEGLCESLAFLAILLVVLLGLDLSQASPSRRQELIKARRGAVAAYKV